MSRARNLRVLLVFAHDVAVAALAWTLAFLLRFNFAIPDAFVSVMWQTLVWVVPLQALVFWRLGLYQGMWRFASLPDLKRILKAVAVATLLVSLAILMTQTRVPRSVLVIGPALLILLMGGSRFAYRAWKEHTLYGLLQAQGKPVLVMGAGDAAALLVKELARSAEWQVVGLLDDDAAKHQRLLNGVRVLGGIERLAEASAQTGARHAIIALPAASHAERRRVLERCAEAGLQTMTVPAFDDLVSGRVSISQIRRIEVEDLLGRDPVQLDESGLHGLIAGRTVLVTGAGGSIGSELCRQVARFRPQLLVLFELNEFALYQLEQEFRARFPQQRIACLIGDVRNMERVLAVLQRYQPALVFHAAAYKHVPLMENANVSEALINNVRGTHTLASACKLAGVPKCVLVSTDKAVNPTNVMGASKRLAEMVCQGLQEAGSTRFVIVRFGNVLGSSGSVIPKFREQIAQGGPLTVTHPEVTRYFMSIPEAAQLVLQAGLMGQGGEVFVLDMGEPIRIVDLAREMIRLSGLAEDDIRIEYSGLRPGEKLFEELLADDEHTQPTPHAKLRIALVRRSEAAWVESLLKWIDATPAMDEALIKQELKDWVEEYQGDAHADPVQSFLTPGSATIH